MTLAADDGFELLRTGEAAGFKAGEPNGHCLQNRSAREALVLEIGTRLAEDAVVYSDIDMVAPAGGKSEAYTRKDGTPYPDEGRKARKV